MIISFILLLILLSFESVIALPLFFLFFVIRRAQHLSSLPRFFYLFFASFALVHFYHLSITLLLISLVIVSSLNSWIRKDKAEWQTIFSSLAFIGLNSYIFLAGQLSFNYFYILQGVLFVVYLFKKYFRTYQRG